MVLPTRIIKPRHKAKVEVAVQIVERFVLAKLRHRRFFSLADLNVAIVECVAATNAKVMRGFGQSRNDLLEFRDRPALSALPKTAYCYACTGLSHRDRRPLLLSAIEADPRDCRCPHHRRDRRPSLRTSI